MKRSIICVILSCLMICSCVTPALSYSEDMDHLSEVGFALRDEIETVSDEEFQAYISNVCDSFTITFQEVDRAEAEMESKNFTAEVLEEKEKKLYKEHNEEVAQQAKGYIMSLGLDQGNYGDLEEFCLKELDYYAEMDDFQVLSYTVHVPKVDNTFQDSSGAPRANYFFFGTFGGRDFYFYYPSTTTGRTTNYKQNQKTVLQQWVNNAVTLMMVFSDIRVSAAFAAFQTIMGAPKNYTVKTGAYIENYFNANVHTRNIVTKYGNGKYETLTTQQFAEVYPYAVFHPVDSPSYPGSVSVDYGYYGQVFSPKYQKSPSDLCKEAWQVYNGALVADKFDYVNMQASKNYWQ